MPSHGVDIIDGIPVILRDGVMFAYQPGSTQTPVPSPIRLGTYDKKTKIAIWEDSPSLITWKESYVASLVPKTRSNRG